MTPKEAYEHAKEYGSSEKTREITCKNSEYAYWYALTVDKKPREDTRNAACKDPFFAYRYALWIDREPREDTRNAVCEKPIWAYNYARYIDKDFHKDTWEAVQNTEWGKKYQKFINSLMKEEII